jgi:uncharacterized protein involved in exopolysaccharide biosynthesis
MPSAPARSEGAAPTLRTILVPLFKDLPYLILVFLLLLGAAGVAAWRLEPSYLAEALLYVKFGREYTYRAQTGEAEVVAQTFDPEKVVKSEVRILVATDSAEVVVAKLGVEAVYPELLEGKPGAVPPEKAAAKRLLDALDAEMGEDGHVIKITYANKDQKAAVAVLDALIGRYMERRRSLFTEQRAEALRPEVEQAHRRLDEAEAALAGFQDQNGIVAFAAQRAQMLDRKAALQVQVEDADRERTGLAERIGRLRTALDATPATLVLQSETTDSDALADARAALLQLRVVHAKLSSEFSATSRQVREVQQQIAQAERSVREQAAQPMRSVLEGRSPVHDEFLAQLTEAEASLKAVEGRQVVLRGQVADASRELALLNAKDGAVTQLTRERDLAEASYRLLAQKLDEAMVLDELAMRDSANVRVLHSARVLAEPKDLRPLVMALGLVAAGVGTLLAAFLRDLLRGGFLTPEQLESETGLPVLATLPVLEPRPWGPPVDAWSWLPSAERS